MNTRARIVAALVAGGLGSALVATSALADAPEKGPEYHWESGGESAIPLLGWSSSQAVTDDENGGGESSSQSSAGTILVPGVSCDADERTSGNPNPNPNGNGGANGNGNARATDESHLVDVAGLRVLGSSCDASRTGDNRSHAGADSSIVSADVADIDVHLLRSESSSWSTSGQSHSRSEVALVSVGELSVGCRSTSRSTDGNGTTTTETTTSLDLVVTDVDGCPIGDAYAWSSGETTQPSENDDEESTS